MTVDEKFDSWISSHRKMLLLRAKAIGDAVYRDRKRGIPDGEVTLARVEFEKRLRDAAEALGPPRFREASSRTARGDTNGFAAPAPARRKRKAKPRKGFPTSTALQG